MSFAFLIQSFLTGLSVGAFCLSSCFPFMATFIAAENRGNRRNIRLVLQFILGRFLGYLIFGLIFGYLGEKWQTPILTLATNISLILISILLILYLTGLVKQQQKTCLASQNKNALIMGFLMGVNICPPFLLSLTYVLSLKSVLLSVAYFSVFFVSSSIYLLPMFFVGMLGKIKELRIAARLSGIISAGIFMCYGAYTLVNALKK
ncbi:MAG: sulfite exporter TauE/SafE family protein [Candidatus Omnitrophica bacterium]|nr:sulfite exporter TauE/SafE family protein [Candidatus Omnitrophota bacterium]